MTYKHFEKGIELLGPFFARTIRVWLSVWTSTGLFKGYGRSFTTGLFSYHGLIGMFEVSPLESPDQVSPFPEFITDQMFGT